MSLPHDLESRFQPPADWQWRRIERDGYALRCGYACPGQTTSVIVALQGVNEFCEKYFEFARYCMARGCAFFMMDWHGQGASARYLSDRERRDANDFAADLADFAAFVDEIVRPNAPSDTPFYLFAHSMGGNLALRHIHDHPGDFRAALLTAPLAGIKSMAKIAWPVQAALSAVLAGLRPTGYALGNIPWRPWNQMTELRMLSTDRERAQVAWRWAEHDPELRAGGVTWRWVREAIRSSRFVDAPGYPESIHVPVTILLAGRERLVDNAAILELGRRLPQGHCIMVEGAKHELVMERDEYRNVVLRALDDMLTDGSPT